MKQQLELKTISTHNTGLQDARRFTVMPKSGRIVILGQAPKSDVWALHLYKLEGRRLQKIRQVNKPCEHADLCDVLGMVVEDEELLAVPCWTCADIKLVNVDTGKISIAYSGEEKPGRLCYGEPGRIWVYLKKDRKDMLRELDCSRKSFTDTGRKVDVTAGCWYVCFVPLVGGALVLSHDDWAEAVSCETGQQLWRLDGKVDGKMIVPHGVALHREHQLLVVADQNNNRILVTDPGSGAQSLPLPGNNPTNFAWLGDQLLLLHGQHGTSISNIRLIDPEKGAFFVALYLSFSVSLKHATRQQITQMLL